jgi:malate synthase
MPEPNQIGCRPNAKVTAEDLLTVPMGDITDEGLVWNIDVGIQYLASWLRGNGCVPIYNLMEDAATAEICRAQVWQWVRHGAMLHDCWPVTADRVRTVIAKETEKLRSVCPGPELETAARLFESMMTSKNFTEFLTLAAYDYID